MVSISPGVSIRQFMTCYETLTREELCGSRYHDPLLGNVLLALAVNVQFSLGALPCFAWFVIGLSEFAGLSGSISDS